MTGERRKGEGRETGPRRSSHSRLCRCLSPFLLSPLLLALQGSGAFAQEPKRLVLERTINTGFPVSEQRVLDVDKDGRDDLLVVGAAGEVRVWRRDEATKRLGEKPVGTLVLRHAERTLLAVADLYGDGRAPQLVEMTKDGVFAHQVEAGGAYARAGDAVAPRAKFPLRVGRPTFTAIARDVDGDKRADLVVPLGEACELWLNGGVDKSSGLPSFGKAATIHVELKREVAVRADALSDVLESSFRAPDLSIADVNGDGRRDLLVEDGDKRAWHLQRTDGSFPVEPDSTLNLDDFKDTTPAATVELGRTLAGGDSTRLETRDLDADGVPDYVIAHRRKVWVFRGGQAAPDFRRKADQMLRTADDVTALLLVRLDDDALPDLLLLRVQAPTVATLLRGLVAEWGIDVAALGYRNSGGASFEPTPQWRGAVDVRLPAILQVLRRPEALIAQFEGAARKFRPVVPGDFDGDERADVALIDAQGDRVDVFVDAGRGGDDGERAIGDVFFGDAKKTWDLSEILRWVGDVAERQASRRTGGAPPWASWELRPEAEFTRAGVFAGDLDGDKRAELVLGYGRGGEGVFDVVRVE
jgi:hypothetical protein